MQEGQGEKASGGPAAAGKARRSALRSGHEEALTGARSGVSSTMAGVPPGAPLPASVIRPVVVS